jgi:hypothetical protein
VDDQEWAQKQLAKRSDGETLVHAVPCRDNEGYDGWLVASNERIWYFQSGIAGGSEEYEYDTAIRRQEVPFSFGKKVMLVIDGSPFTLPTATADEFEAVVQRMRGGGAGR